jgi:hypothetical protein
LKTSRTTTPSPRAPVLFRPAAGVLAFQVANFLHGSDCVSVSSYEPVIGGVHFALYLLLALGEAVEIGEVLAAPQPLSAG